jgi:CBS domain-containing protein
LLSTKRNCKAFLPASPFPANFFVISFAEGDFLNRVALKGLNPKETKLRDVMTRKITTITGNTPFTEALRIMTNQSIRNLPIMPVVGDDLGYDTEKYPVIGLVTEIDIITFLLRTSNLIKE